MALATGSLLILLVILLNRSRFMIFPGGSKLLLLLCIIAMLRCLFPVEFSAGWEIELTELNGITDALRSVTRQKADSPVSFTTFIAVWVSVSGLSLLVYTLIYLATSYRLHQLASTSISNDMQAIIPKKHKKILRIARYSENISPFVFGLVRPVIILPGYSLSNAQLRFILEHEYHHYRLKHLWIRLFMDLICIALWWFPIVFLLKKALFSTLELCCDRAVMKGKITAEILDYGQALLEISSRNLHPQNFSGSGFSNDKAIIKRFDYLLAATKATTSRRITVILFTSAIVCVVIVSYLIILQPQYPPQGDGIIGISALDDIVKNGDGTYSIQAGGRVIIMTESDYSRILE